ncbi:MAG: Hsp33 family molecular chaperone HslO [Christensenellaceae bacterium]|nr:Hsp33 family molecular chaperone HslO [Christensenellaceae bacterium]
MSNTSVLTKFLLNDEVSVVACDTTALVREAKEIHGTYPVATAVLGRTLSAAVMMASQLKHESHNLTININGGGPAGTIIATAKADGTVKGCIANPEVNLPAREDGKLDVGGAVGTDGFLTVVKDIGLKEPYVGRTQLESGEIAEDLAYYYLQSEQQPTVVYLSVWVDVDTSVLTAGGLIISPLPGASEKTLSQIEERLFVVNNYALMLMQQTPAEAVKNIFKGMDVKELEEMHPRYECDCAEERIEQVIISLGEKEIRDMIEEDGKAEVVCRFCNKKYTFDAAHLSRLLSEATAKGQE